MDQSSDFPYTFNPDTCQSCGGICCRGSTGHVFISEDEIMTIARILEIDLDNFSHMYLRITEGKLALQERRVNGEYFCCFFDPYQVRCTIYEHRPDQCRTYPFWEQFRNKPHTVQHECPGVILKIQSTKM